MGADANHVVTVRGRPSLGQVRIAGGGDDHGAAVPRVVGGLLRRGWARDVGVQAQVDDLRAFIGRPFDAFVDVREKRAPIVADHLAVQYLCTPCHAGDAYSVVADRRDDAGEIDVRVDAAVQDRHFDVLCRRRFPRHICQDAKQTPLAGWCGVVDRCAERGDRIGERILYAGQQPDALRDRFGIARWDADDIAPELDVGRNSRPPSCCRTRRRSGWASDSATGVSYTTTTRSGETPRFARARCRSSAFCTRSATR